MEKSEATLRHYRIDATHSNVFDAWKRLGSPAAPNAEQCAQLEKSGQLEELAPAQSIALAEHGATLKAPLPGQAVSLLALSS